MFKLNRPLILASASERRRDILLQAALPFEVQAADIDETVGAGESAFDLVQRLAKEKAEAVAQHAGDSWVLGADTVVVDGLTILGKPADEQDATRTLQSLQGTSHRVIGGIALVNSARSYCSVRCVDTTVEMLPTSQDLIERYVASGEPMGKAGSYAIQGLGAFLVSRISGSYLNVVGLDVASVVNMLREAGALVEDVG